MSNNTGNRNKGNKKNIEKRGFLLPTTSATPPMPQVKKHKENDERKRD